MKTVQKHLLRRNYELIQLPVALVFDTLTDGAVWAIQGIAVQGYAGPVGWCVPWAFCWWAWA